MATLIFKVSLSDQILANLEAKENEKTEGDVTGIETLTLALEAGGNRIWHADYAQVEYVTDLANDNQEEEMIKLTIQERAYIKDMAETRGNRAEDEWKERESQYWKDQTAFWDTLYDKMA